MTSFESENIDQQPDRVDLITALGDPKWRVRHDAVNGINELDADAITMLVDTLRDGHRDLSRLNATIQVLTRISNDVIPSLLPLLTDADADTRGYAALALGLRGDPRAIPDLVRSMSDPDRNVQVHTIEALGRLHASEALDSLIQFVESRDFEVAFPALDALMAIGDERVAARLIPLLKVPLLDTAAVEALGALGGQEAVIALCNLFGNSAVSIGTIAGAIQKIHHRYVARYHDGHTVIDLVRQATGLQADALRTAISESSVNEAEALITIMSWLSGKEVETALCDLLERPELRRFSLNALSTKGTEIVPQLLERLESSPLDIQLDLIDLFAHMADRRTLPALVRFLSSDEDDVVITKSLEALTRFGDRRVYEHAKALLGHQNPRIRHAAVGAINALGHPDAAQDMEKSLDDPSPLMRDSALKVAAYFGFPNCLDSIFACAESPDESIRRTAIEHLPCLDDDRVAIQLQKAIESENAAIRKAAAGALGEMTPQIAVPLLKKALKDDDVWVRYVSLRSLAEFPLDSEANETLASIATSDAAMQVRIAAVKAISSDPSGVLIELSEAMEDDLAIAAIEALGRLGMPVASPALIAAFRSPQGAKKVAAMRSLGNLGLVGIEPLGQVAMGRDQSLADEAIAALGRIHAEESADLLLKIMEIPARRFAASAALIAQGDEGLKVIARQLQTLTVDVRLALIQVLVGNQSQCAKELLETELATGATSVRYAAMSALANTRHMYR